MRNKLADQSGNRKKFRAIFTRIGKKTNYLGHAEETILLNNVVDFETGQTITDHIWFSYTMGFQKAGVKPGDQIEFDARIKIYKKGYVNSRYGVNNQKQDYKLSHPTQIKVIKRT